MVPQKPDKPNKCTGSFMWTVHEKMRRTIDERIQKSAVGEHTGEASAPSGIQSQNLQAAADRVVRHCGAFAERSEAKGFNLNLLEKKSKTIHLNHLYYGPFNPFN